MATRLLVLSNGHGEDLIALRIIQALAARRPDLEIAVLPLVGEGQTFASAASAGLLRRIGPRRTLPSGGFSNQSLRGLLADLAAGVLGLSWRQWRLVRQWGRRGDPVLAVGDLLPLLLAWSAGGPYGFIGTPKSDFTWATPAPAGWPGGPWDALADAYHRCKGSEWDPWEWALMRSRRCRLVAVRDRLTARGLRRRGVAALAPGNPMMDGFQTPAATADPLTTPSQTPIPQIAAPLAAAPLTAWKAEIPDSAIPGARVPASQRLLLLPGSRMPEALANARRLLQVLTALADQCPGQSFTARLATGARPTPPELAPLLESAGFTAAEPPASALRSIEPLATEPPPTGAPAAGASWRRGPLQLLIGAGCFNAWAPWAAVGLATAGTATEQLVGLGVATLSLPGAGPQFKAGFARRQSRLLGGAVLPCASPQEAAERLALLLREPALRHRLGRIGRRRMGGAGGSARLAALVEQRLLG